MNTKNRRWKIVKGGISAPTGFHAVGVKAGIKYQEKFDIALLKSELMATAAGMFTRNVVKAHPLVLTEKHLKDSKAQAVIINSGNANACMGEIGDRAAWQMAEATAEELGTSPENILVSSTGVIGQAMSMDKVLPGIRLAVQELKHLEQSNDAQLKADQAHKAALAIMTTDLVPKELAMELECASGTVKLGIMAKGSGMIHPNMGTMLCFITTDAKVEAGKLKELLQEATDETFNMITVDGDTSTNDMIVILANGASGVKPEGDDWHSFSGMVKEACCEMAKAIARDGEGASKFLEVRVTGARSLDDARKIARSVTSSSLVKSALYGEDANWGRVLAAAGYSGANFNPRKADIFLNNLQVAKNGQGLEFSEEEASVRLKEKDIIILISLQDGNISATAWGCDLTHKYVDINADYRT
ncbi:MAG: ornithine acetyltransferase [Gracilibacter sp. BRH_c7a]|nr:MAG: ornithine acetyltransferase [Gracilibacter sp. BRH_c7a]